ncbi:MAG: methyltransferase domain-containing protein [Chitinivibrionales bacterium]|nr:methyltransferase domain-containing protein [Chitinivibrionales bacterium]
MVYTGLAPIYDRVMIHVRYEQWVGLITRIVKKYLSRTPITVFEIGGGTAVLGKMLIDKGFAYTGSDISTSMCFEAKKKVGRFIVADGRLLPVKSGFDMVLFLYDGINYLMNLDDYTRLFSETWNILKPFGLFLFDITTFTNSIHYFNDYYDHEDLGEYFYSRHSYYQESDHTQHNDFTIYRRHNNSTPDEKMNEYHTQKLFHPEEISARIPKDKFDLIGIWDGYGFKKYSDTSERIHFLLRKKPAA